MFQNEAHSTGAGSRIGVVSTEGTFCGDKEAACTSSSSARNQRKLDADQDDGDSDSYSNADKEDEGRLWEAMDTGDTAGAKNDGSRVKKRRCAKWMDNGSGQIGTRADKIIADIWSTFFRHVTKEKGSIGGGSQERRCIGDELWPKRMPKWVSRRCLPGCYLSNYSFKKAISESPSCMSLVRWSPISLPVTFFDMEGLIDYRWLGPSFPRSISLDGESALFRPLVSQLVMSSGLSAAKAKVA